MTSRGGVGRLVTLLLSQRGAVVLAGGAVGAAVTRTSSERVDRGRQERARVIRHSSRDDRPIPSSLRFKSSHRWCAASGVAAVASFVLGLVFADLLASAGFPAYDASLERIDAFFIDDRAEAIGISVCHSLSAAALLVFVPYLHESLPRGGTETRLAALALGGGVAGSVFLLQSAVLYWTLTRAEVAREPGAAQAVLVLSYLAGGQTLALSLRASSARHPSSRSGRAPCRRGSGGSAAPLPDSACYPSPG